MHMVAGSGPVAAVGDGNDVVAAAENIAAALEAIQTDDDAGKEHQQTADVDATVLGDIGGDIQHTEPPLAVHTGDMPAVGMPAGAVVVPTAVHTDSVA